MANKKGILLVEDHPLMRDGIKSLIVDTGDFKVVAEAATVALAREAFQKAGPELVLLDLTLPDGSGLDLIPEFLARRPATHIVVLTMHNEGPFLAAAISRGAHGYVVKDMAPEKLIFTLRSVLTGEKCFFSSNAEPAAPARVSAAQSKQALSAREEKVMTMLVSGKTLTEIAGDLGLSVKTVFTYRVRLLKKLGLKNNAELIKSQYGGALKR